MKFILVLLLAVACFAGHVPNYHSSYVPSLVPGLFAPYYVDNHEPYPFPIGRQGIGFDQRTALAYGFRVPLTPELYQVLRKDPAEMRPHSY